MKENSIQQRLNENDMRSLTKPIYLLYDLASQSLQILMNLYKTLECLY